MLKLVILFAHLAKSSPFNFFDSKGIKQQQPFFYQALTELGMYSYEVDPFKKYINYDKDLTFDFTLPEGADGTFNPESMIAVRSNGYRLKLIKCYLFMANTTLGRLLKLI